MDTKSAADVPIPPSQAKADVEVTVEPKAEAEGDSVLALGQKPADTDGGLHARLTVAGTFVAMFCQFGLANAYGAFQAYYEEHQLSAYTSDTVGWIGGVQQFCLLFGVSSQRGGG